MRERGGRGDASTDGVLAPLRRWKRRLCGSDGGRLKQVSFTCPAELRSRNLIRSHETGDTQMVETYHDRLCEVVQSLLSAPERLELDRKPLLP